MMPPKLFYLCLWAISEAVALFMCIHGYREHKDKRDALMHGKALKNLTTPPTPYRDLD